MEANFTPIDVEKLKKHSGKVTIVLFMVTTVTIAVMAVLFFILLQKQKIKQPALPNVYVTPSTAIPTVLPSQVPSPLPSGSSRGISPESSLSGVTVILPTKTTSDSSNIK